MKRDVFLWVVIGVLFVLALYLVFQAGSSSYSTLETAGNAVKGSVSPTSYSGMVGGC